MEEASNNMNDSDSTRFHNNAIQATSQMLQTRKLLPYLEPTNTIMSVTCLYEIFIYSVLEHIIINDSAEEGLHFSFAPIRAF